MKYFVLFLNFLLYGGLIGFVLQLRELGGPLWVPNNRLNHKWKVFLIFLIFLQPHVTYQSQDLKTCDIKLNHTVLTSFRLPIWVGNQHQPKILPDTFSVNGHEGQQT